MQKLRFDPLDAVIHQVEHRKQISAMTPEAEDQQTEIVLDEGGESPETVPKPDQPAKEKKKRKSLGRDNQIKTRLTDAELVAFNARLEKSGLAQGDFVRSAILHEKIEVRETDPYWLNILDDLSSLRAEIGRQSGLLKQLKKTNENWKELDPEGWARLVRTSNSREGYKKAIAKLEEAMEDGTGQTPDKQNANYAAALDYLTMQYRRTQKGKDCYYAPILDEDGIQHERMAYALTYITADGREDSPERWESACLETNIRFRKNQGSGDRKQHEYIISHPVGDRARLTMDDLLNEGRRFARKFLRGYDVLIAVHRDTDHDHIHIIINSVRAKAREQETWMMRDETGAVLNCEMAAGCKHQDSALLRREMNKWLLQDTWGHGLAQEDNNAKADARKEQRHKSKNDQMRSALLDAAARCKSMQEIRKILADEYKMTLKVRGNTISIQHPDAQKAVRLRTLGLEPAMLTRLMWGEPSQEELERQRWSEIEQKERKKYIDWIRERRQKNNEKAEEAIARAELLVAQELRSRGEKYSRTEFRDLNYLIRQTAYISSNLQTEADKLDNVLGRWERYRDTSLPQPERMREGGYIRWCGCDPENALDLEDLQLERKQVLQQKEQIEAVQEALVATGTMWKGQNDLAYAADNLAWAAQRKRQLKQQIRDIKASRRELGIMAYNCEQAARRHGEGTPVWEKANRLRGIWYDKGIKQFQLEKKLKDVKTQEKMEKSKVKEAKKNSLSR